MGPMLSYAGVQPHVRPDSRWDPTQTALLGQSQRCFSCFYLAPLGGIGEERPPPVSAGAPLLCSPLHCSRPFIFAAPRCDDHFGGALIP